MSKREYEAFKCFCDSVEACCGNCRHFKNEDADGIGWCDIRECSAGVSSLCQTWNYRGKELILPLKKKWFEMIKSGEKPEEYREINEYWSKRLICKDAFYDFKSVSIEELIKTIIDNNDTDFFNDFSDVEFTCGYPKKDDTERRITFKNPSIRIDVGKEKWGAEKGKIYFVITWEK